MDRDELCRRLERIRDDMANDYRSAKTLEGLMRGVDRTYSEIDRLTNLLWKADPFTIETGIGR